jgi:mono/diheme cytochrome c family protein
MELGDRSQRPSLLNWLLTIRQGLEAVTNAKAARIMRSAFILSLFAFWVEPSIANEPTGLKAANDFSRDIRPILAKHCFACHGPDPATRQAELRLDQPFSDPQRIVDRINASAPELRMPPPETNRPLSEQQRKQLSDWVSSGALFGSHWAFKRPEVPQVPTSSVNPSATDPIDAFLNVSQSQLGLTANPSASREEFLRRVTLDLTGLPPTIEELDDFVRDTSNSAHERVVDRLLSSPRFGEHMSRYWLDLVRYADTHGLHFDNYREVWPYRDWVVRSFNENIPFDQFLTEQLAGDLLQPPTTDSLIASGFNRLNLTTSESGSIYEEIQSRNVVDRTEAFGSVFLGMTLACAACHDHKYDPISQRDFYSLSAYFNSLDLRALDGNAKDHPPFLRIFTPAASQELAAIDKVLSDLDSERQALQPTITNALRTWTASLVADSINRTSNSIPTVIQLGPLHQTGPFMVESVHAAYHSSFASQEREFLFDETFVLPDQTFRWHERTDFSPAFPLSLPTVNDRSSVTVLHTRITTNQPCAITLLLGNDDGYQVWLNGNLIAELRSNREHLLLSDQISLELTAGTNDLYIKIVQEEGPSQVSLALRSANLQIPSGLLALAHKLESERTETEQQKLLAYYWHVATDNEEWQDLRDTIRFFEKQRESLVSRLPTTLIAQELPVPRSAHVLLHGDYSKPAESVERALPPVLAPGIRKQPESRLELAQWLTSSENPLTARVVVNRLWQQIFGVGIVKTSDDFGSQGEPPLHPEILDMLAIDFMRSGWDYKRLVRRLVLTDAYRRSSQTTWQLQKLDPENRYLARGPRLRLDAETIRDNALFVSGMLVEEIGGPSVKPPQPDGIWSAVAYPSSNTFHYVADSGGNAQRRSLYTFWKRTSAPPQFTIWDAPSRERCTSRRERTNTPMQSLVLLNEPQYFAAARAMIESLPDDILAKPQSVIATLFRRTTSQCISSTVEGELLDLYEELSKFYAEDRELMDQLGVDNPQRAALLIVASTLLNLDATIHN